jgi:hypothetical protein
MSSDGGGGGGIAPAASTRAPGAPAQHDSAAASSKRALLRTGARAAARTEAEAVVREALCDACGGAAGGGAGERKRYTDDERSLCAACLADSAKAARIERVEALRNALRRGEAAALGLSIEAATRYWFALLSTPENHGASLALRELAGNPLFAFVVRGDGALTRALAPAASAARALLRRVDDFVAGAAALSLVFPPAFVDALRSAAREVGTEEADFVAKACNASGSFFSRVDVAEPAQSCMWHFYMKQLLSRSTAMHVSHDTDDFYFLVNLATLAKDVFRGRSARLPAGLLVSTLFQKPLARAPWAPLTADNARHVCSSKFAQVVRWLSDSHTAPFNALPEPVLLRILNAATEKPGIAAPEPQPGAERQGGRRGGGQHHNAHNAPECAHARCRNSTASKGQPCAFSMCGTCCRRDHPGACVRHR